MCLQIPFLCKCLVTFRTGKWLFSYVDPFMWLQIAYLCKCFVTFAATNASLLCGSFHVSSNHFLCKWLVTFGAGKRHLSCVDPFMSPLIIFLCKCLVTFGVGQKAPLLCGSFHVLSNHLYVNVLPQLEQANGFTPL